MPLRPTDRKISEIKSLRNKAGWIMPSFSMSLIYNHFLSKMSERLGLDRAQYKGYSPKVLLNSSIPFKTQPSV